MTTLSQVMDQAGLSTVNLDSHLDMLVRVSLMRQCSFNVIFAKYHISHYHRRRRSVSNILDGWIVSGVTNVSGGLSSSCLCINNDKQSRLE